MADSPGLEIHRLRHLDPDLLARLKGHGEEALGESALDEWMLPVIADFGYLFVGTLEGETVGAAEVIRCTGANHVYLEGFYVRPAYQRRGIGRRLLEGVAGLLAAEGFSRLLATVDPANEAGLGLYEKAGFTRREYLPDYYGRGRHRYLLLLKLGDWMKPPGKNGSARAEGPPGRDGDAA